jgi:hypothetical protein
MIDDRSMQQRIVNLENANAKLQQAVAALQFGLADAQSKLALVRQAPVSGGPASGNIEYAAWVPSATTWAAATGTAPTLTPGPATLEIYSSTGGGIWTDTGHTQTVYNDAGAIVGPALVILDQNNHAMVVPC